ncbi:uncharacterized protein LY89DRAFT_691619 [Mollisia scopiformis]|uniref:Uncharacterized protein n=1 Tax=Mollisia scopiformis TaxID=149040 RepID=A0A132B5B3_MOLSC|nr:uncharacterized protein LY89DRAFT_691619 [Mollisia scopiformis]KUJ07531.1 hypothetical protein LY89DRAFT_691619 [Mollisia scopiformis]
MHPKAILPFFFFLLTIASTLPETCAPNNGIMTTPTYGTTGAIFTICAQTTILSSPLPIYDVLTNFPCYAAWNTFVYAIDLPSNYTTPYVGLQMTFHTSGLILGFNTTSNELVTYLEPDATPPFVSWRLNAGVLGVLMQAEHVSALWDLGNGSTSYVSWETYYGAGALATLALEANLQTQFEVQGQELKERIEGGG